MSKRYILDIPVKVTMRRFLSEEDVKFFREKLEQEMDILDIIEEFNNDNDESIEYDYESNDLSIQRGIVIFDSDDRDNPLFKEK